MNLHKQQRKIILPSIKRAVIFTALFIEGYLLYQLFKGLQIISVIQTELCI